MNDKNTNINEEYLEIFQQLICEQLARAELLKEGSSFTDYAQADKITVGIIPGDGIGPVIMTETVNVLEKLLADEIKSGKIELRPIAGLTLENRVGRRMKPCQKSCSPPSRNAMCSSKAQQQRPTKTADFRISKAPMSRSEKSSTSSPM